MKQVTIKQGLGVGLLGLALVVSGCQSNPSRSVELDNTRFMSLWETYSDCKVASDLSQASRELQRLTAAVQIQDQKARGFVLPLPATLERLLSNPKSRLAVDVRAMTAACSIHKGRLALYQGRIDVARDAFSSVLTLEQDLSPYYILQAKRFLSELEQGLEIALTTP